MRIDRALPLASRPMARPTGQPGARPVARPADSLQLSQLAIKARTPWEPIQAYLESLMAPPDRAYGSLEERLANDPNVRAAAAPLYASLRAEVAAGNVTAANSARDKLLETAGGDPALALGFARQRAREAYEAAATKPAIGANTNFNPYWSYAWQAAHAGSDLAYIGTVQRREFQAALQAMADQGLKTVRTELAADLLPSEPLIIAYDLFQANGTFPRGKKVADFLKACNDPGFLDQLRGQGIALDDDARAELADPAIARRLAYLQMAETQLDVFASLGGNPKGDWVLSLGDFNHYLDDGRRGQFRLPEPGTPQRRAAEAIAGKVHALGARAAAAGIDSLELHNEPNLSEDPAFWTPDRNEPRSIINAARRYAFVAGLSYQGLKGDPNLANLTVDAAPMSFTNRLEYAFYPARREDFPALLPGASAQTLARFEAVYQEAEAAGDEKTFLGAMDRLFTMYEQAQKTQDPHYDPIAYSRGNNAIVFLREVHRAQRDFFGLGEREPIMSDRTNIHLYGTPQAQEALVKEYGQLLAEGKVPARATLTEFGSRLDDRQQQATELYDQIGTLLPALEARGFGLEQMLAFSHHETGGYGIADNPAFRPGDVTGQAPIARPAPQPSFFKPSLQEAPAPSAPPEPQPPKPELTRKLLLQWLVWLIQVFMPAE